MKNNANRGGGYREAEESIFDEEYGLNIVKSPDSWIKCDDYAKLDQSQIIFQGKLHQKNSRTKKWQSFHFELYSDRLVRVALSINQSLNNQNQNNANSADKNNQNVIQPSTQSAIEIPDTGPDFLPINACYLKKIKYSDTSYSNYKFGIRLQRGEIKSEIFTDNSESFNKLYDEIKRFCILPKFTKKYKVLTKIKPPPHMPNVHLYKCFRFSDSTQHCVRIIEKYSLSDQGRNAVLKETAILRKIDHPSLLKLDEVYEDDTSIFLIYELLQGKDLKSNSAELIAMDEKSVSDFLWKLLHGLSHLHNRNIIHRDIRLDNVFFRIPNNFQEICITNYYLADFINQSNCVGSSSAFIPSKQNYKKYGTPGYMAPEVFKNKSYDQKVDIFSLGVIFYFLVFGKFPFEAKEGEEILKLNEKCEIDFTSPFTGKFTSCAFDLMQNMLDKDPQKRGEASDLLNHTWFVKNRGEYGIRGNNYYMFSTLSTVVENTEMVDMNSSNQDFIIKGKKDGIKNLLNFSNEFSNIKKDEDQHSNYIHNVVQDGSLIYEDEFMKETVFDKMCFLNKIQFMKVPSKFRHDSFHYHISSRLGINIQEFYNGGPIQGSINNIINNSALNNNLNGNANNTCNQTQSMANTGNHTTGANSLMIFNENSNGVQAQLLSINSLFTTTATPLSTIHPLSKDDCQHGQEEEASKFLKQLSLTQKHSK